jgi:hypothetical protein
VVLPRPCGCRFAGRKGSYRQLSSGTDRQLAADRVTRITVGKSPSHREPADAQQDRNGALRRLALQGVSVFQP